VKQHGFRLLSTGGTAKLLADGRPAGDRGKQHTGFPEIMEGRVENHCIQRSTRGCCAGATNPTTLAQAREEGIALMTSWW